VTSAYETNINDLLEAPDFIDLLPLNAIRLCVIGDVVDYVD
jgi:hypothetical protein